MIRDYLMNTVLQCEKFAYLKAENKITSRRFFVPENEQSAGLFITYS